MATLRPFKAFRPKPEFAFEVAAKPYDVLNSDEAREEVAGHPHSFLHVGKPEVDLDSSIPLYDPLVYETGKRNLHRLIQDGILVEDASPSFYLYAQTMNGHTQYGIVGCASVDEYWNDTIKKHELTRKDKEEDRCNHVRVTNAHTGPIFLTYRDSDAISEITRRIAETHPDNDHIASDGVRHRSWVIDNPDLISRLSEAFMNVPILYVADGHHRSAAAAIVGRERKEANPAHTGLEEYNFFLAVCFPASQLRIMDYNRVVRDLNGLSVEEFLDRVRESFTITRATGEVHPSRKGEFGMFLEGVWYSLRIHETRVPTDDPVERLDVSLLQNHLLAPILGITDPRTDKRIDFVGGIRGLGELERRVRSGEMAVALSLHPTSIDELMAIADVGKIMPPKSTWFEPKLRDGLFVHFLD